MGISLGNFRMKLMITSYKLVEALRSKPEGRGFDSQRGHYTFHKLSNSGLQYSREVESASNRNEYQGYLLGGKGGRCTGLQPYYRHVPITRISETLNLLQC
jgi:hypothetical protein